MLTTTCFFLLVPVRPTACDQAERMQEVVHGSDARKECVPLFSACLWFQWRLITSCGPFLPKLEVLAVPKNMKLLAIPLFELYDNAAR